MKLSESKTYLNLAKAFAGESQAYNRYKFISYNAQQEGYIAMSDVVKTVMTNEFNHARMFYTFIQTATEKTIENIDICSGYPFKEKWNLLDNLKFASEDESNESARIYPEYARIAREEGFKDIAGLFENTAKVESCHSKLFGELHTQLRDGSLYKKPAPVKWKCADCGHEEVSKDAFSVCPLCQAKQGHVMLILSDN